MCTSLALRTSAESTTTEHPPALDIALLLKKRGTKVTYSEPFVPQVRFNGEIHASRDAQAIVTVADCVLIVTDHARVDYARVAERAKLIVDTRNALNGFTSEKIVRL